MPRKIALDGRAKRAAVGLVLLFLLGSWLAPSVLSSVTGSGERSYSYGRGGYVEQHKTNLTGHWLTSAKGMYNSAPFFALAGERVVMRHETEVLDGKVVFIVAKLEWMILRDYVWTEWIGASARDRFTFTAPETGFYRFQLSFVGFEGSVAVDWEVE